MMIIIIIPFDTEFHWTLYEHLFKACGSVNLSKVLPVVHMKMSSPDSDLAPKL